MATSIYPTISNKIQEILDLVVATGKLKETFAYPASKLTKYPAAIYYPSSFSNEPGTNQQEFKTYTYKLWIVIGAGQKNISEIFSSVMPNVMDEVLEKFDANWDLDSIDGSRVWLRVNPGEWNVSSEQDGLEVSAELDIEVKLLTNN